jgi:hypothetical protein
MSFVSRFKKLVGINVREAAEANTVDPSLPDLREFVYLDEVSLRSLLSSQKGGVTDSTSEQSTDGRAAEIAGTVGANPGFVAKAEVVSRYQTSNSSTIQTSRKATVQSWFRELHLIPGLRLIEPGKPSKTPSTSDELLAIDDKSLVASGDDLRRGRLIEFRVRLGADPVFHLGTMVSEFTAMAEDHPDMFAAGNALAGIHDLQPINKILQRLLAGLIPIRALAVDYEVVELGGTEYIVHKDLNRQVKLSARPLEIVGVTEHEAYWKDLRRVLFSDAEFTVLARISRPGLHATWTPVKLADLFADLTPGLVDQINAASRGAFSGIPSTSQESSAELRLGNALRAYADALVSELGGKLTDEQTTKIAREIELLKLRASTVSDQRSAFATVTDRVAGDLGVAPTPDRALELREKARAAAGLSLFPGVASQLTTKPKHPDSDPPEERLLDVDVIAIYW